MNITIWTRLGQVFYIFDNWWTEAVVLNRGLLSILWQRIRTIFCRHIEAEDVSGIPGGHWICGKCKTEFGDYDAKA